MSDKQEYVSVETLAASLGIPPQSIHLVLGSKRMQITQAEADFVVDFHQRLNAEADAARARIKAHAEEQGITPAEDLRRCFEYLQLHYPNKTLPEAMAEIDRKEALKRFSLAAAKTIAETLQPPHPSSGRTMEPFELAMQVGRIVAEEFERLDVFTPEELEQMGLEFGWPVVEEYQTTVSEETVESVLVEIRSRCRECVERLLSEQE